MDKSSRSDRQQAIEALISAFNPDADEAEELLLVLQGRLQERYDRQDTSAVDKAIDDARDALISFNAKLADNGPDEMDLSRADRQRRDEAELQP